MLSGPICVVSEELIQRLNDAHPLPDVEIPHREKTRELYAQMLDAVKKGYVCPEVVGDHLVRGIEKGIISLDEVAQVVISNAQLATTGNLPQKREGIVLSYYDPDVEARINIY